MTPFGNEDRELELPGYHMKAPLGLRTCLQHRDSQPQRGFVIVAWSLQGQASYAGFTVAARSLRTKSDAPAASSASGRVSM